MHESESPEPLPLALPETIPEPVAAVSNAEPVPSLSLTLRRFLHILILLFSLFLLVRTIFLEPFGVTTGSMAETIHGNRRELPCPRCGYTVCIGSMDEARGGYNPQETGICPNCALTKLNLSKVDETFGDRLLVDKFAFRTRNPHRWEVAVFRCPDDDRNGSNKRSRDTISAAEARLPFEDDRKPYVKRVVGLPNEKIRIFDGDIYIDGAIQRKSLDQVRAMRIPFFEIDSAPQPDGWGLRFEIGPVLGATKLPNAEQKTLPTISEVLKGNELVLDGTERPFGLTYRHRDFDSKKDEVVRDWLGYNGAIRRETAPVHDFIVECEVEATGSGVFACRLGDGADTVKLDLPIGEAGEAVIAHENGVERLIPKAFLKPGKKTKLEFAFVDRRVFFAIDGKEFAEPLDLPPLKDPSVKRNGLDRPVQFGIRGASLTIRHLMLYRDIHYRSEEGKHATRSEYRLGADEYFVLGDNSANSRDSREWDIPGVPERDFLGKPFWVHQPLRMGQLPILGRVQTIDWTRFRALE